MRVTSNEKLDKFQIVGPKLRIHWGYEEVAPDPEVEDSVGSWSCEEAVVKKTASRNDIIEAVIATKYSVPEELAAINNGGDEYESYQSFRQVAKDLADEWFESD